MIERAVEKSAGRRYDAIVIGGGIHGVFAALEAARRGFRTLLLEQHDFAGATSWNSFRILHGGLRYLQHIDLSRFRESVRERRWFCQHLPELVTPLPCAMPLYGRGAKRRSIFRAALNLNDTLARHRNRGVPEQVQLPRSAILSRAQSLEKMPGIETTALQGAGLWYDAALRSPPRAIMALLHWFTSLGGVALNRVRAERVLCEHNRTVGVVGRDETAGVHWRFRAPVVINAAGPWARALARQMDGAMSDHAMNPPSLAFNMLVARAPLANCAVAIETPGVDGQVYFARPYGSQTFIGTGHAPWPDAAKPPRVDGPTLDRCLQAINRAMPGFDLSADEVTRLMPGLLPARATGGSDLTDRPVIYEHARYGGPHGLVTMEGIKFTTARAVAARAVRRALGNTPYSANTGRPKTQSLSPAVLDASQAYHCSDAALRQLVDRLIDEEAVGDLDDLMQRRTEWGLDPMHGPALHTRVQSMFNSRLPECVDGMS